MAFRLPHRDPDSIHLALHEDGVPGGALVVQTCLDLVDLLGDGRQLLGDLRHLRLGRVTTLLSLVNLALQEASLTLETLNLPEK